MNEQKNTEQEVQAPIRYKLEGSVINDIKTEIYSILRKNNLSIRQVRSVLSVLSEELDDYRPWNQTTRENSNNG